MLSWESLFGVKGLACIHIIVILGIEVRGVKTHCPDGIQTFFADMASLVGSGRIVVVADGTSLIHLMPPYRSWVEAKPWGA